MKDKDYILHLIKLAINKTEPDSTIILYGSYARGDYRENSDFDLLVLINKDKVTRTDQKRIKYPLYEIEFETGTIISPLVFAKKEWETLHWETPFYENISKEGKIL